jgi:Lon protease-like protein
LPLFPMSLVLFPKATLPLHIFEDRYQQMIGELLENNGEFGVILADGGGVASAGCTAMVDRVVERYPDGRLDILTRGVRRFEILLLNNERPYLRAAVEFFDDLEEDAPPGPQVLARALRAYEEYQQFDHTRKDRETPDEGPALNDRLLSFQLARTVPDLIFRQLVLATRSESERLKHIADFLPGYLARQRLITHVKTVAPKNGHGKRSVEG